MAAEKVECACVDCVCKIASDTAVMKDGQPYRCEECASGHAHHKGCDHDGCECHG